MTKPKRVTVPTEADLANHISRKRRGRTYTTLERYQILELHRRNPEMPYTEIARLLGRDAMAVRLVCLAANRTAMDLMAAEADLRLEDWRKASEVAGKRGDHRPAKEWMMHAGALEQLPDAGRGNGPAVVIINSPLPGMPGGVQIGVSHALEGRVIQEGDQSEHSDRDRSREAAEAGRRDRPEHGS